MAKISLRRFSIDSFFEFAAGVSPFDLVDIVNETEHNVGHSFETASGEFSYRTHFFVKQQMAEQLGIEGVHIEMFKVDPRLNKVRSSDAISSFEVRFETAGDMRQKIGGTNLGNTTSVVTPPDAFKRIVVSSKAAPTLNRLSIPGQKTFQEKTFKQASQTAKMNGADPAMLARGGSFSATTALNAVSLDGRNVLPIDRTKEKTIGKQALGGRSLSTAREVSKRNVREISNDLTNSLSSASQGSTLSNAAFITLLPSKREFVRILNIKKGKVAGSDKIYVRLSVITNKKNKRVFDDKVIEIQHNRELDEFLSNPEPPELSLSSVGYSYVAVKIQRTDPSLRSIKIFRIVTNPNLNRVLVDDVANLSFSTDDVLLFRDVVDNVKPNRIVYRVAVINGDGSVGEFSSIVIPSLKKVSDPLNSAGVPMSIRAKNYQDSVRIRVTTLSNDIFTVRLLRQEIGKTGSFSDTIEVIPSASGDTMTFVNGQKDSFEFRDTTSLLGRKYRYFAAYRVGNPGYASLGQEIMSDEDEIIIRRFLLGEIPFAVSVTDADTGQDSDNNTTVSFNILSEETTDIFNAVISALQGAGIGNEFVSALQKDGVKAKLFTMFLVERFEYSTGRRVSFGIVPAGKFSDSSTTRLARGIPPPVTGEKYEYIVKTCLQQPEVFLQSSNVGVINRYGDEIKRKGARFARLIYDKLGVMPPETDVLNGKSIESLVIESQIGQELSVYAKIPSVNPSIENLFVTEKSFYNSLTWQIVGDVSKVSYFLVYCSLNGHDQLLGSVACSRSASQYRFRDDRFFAEVGEKSYSVRAVSFDDDEFVKSAPASSDRLFSVPENLVVGIAYADFGKKSKILPVDPINLALPTFGQSFAPIIFETSKSVGSVFSQPLDLHSPGNLNSIQFDTPNFSQSKLQGLSFQQSSPALPFTDDIAIITKNAPLSENWSVLSASPKLVLGGFSIPQGSVSSDGNLEKFKSTPPVKSKYSSRSRGQVR